MPRERVISGDRVIIMPITNQVGNPIKTHWMYLGQRNHQLSPFLASLYVLTFLKKKKKKSPECSLLCRKKEPDVSLLHLVVSLGFAEHGTLSHGETKNQQREAQEAADNICGAPARVLGDQVRRNSARHAHTRDDRCAQTAALFW